MTLIAKIISYSSIFLYACGHYNGWYMGVNVNWFKTCKIREYHAAYSVVYDGDDFECMSISSACLFRILTELNYKKL